MKTGIYVILNVLTDKRYVGGAYKSLEHRRRKHWSDLAKGIHFNPHLQNAWNKYGSDAFRFVIVEYCSVDRCKSREQYWIRKLKAAQNRYGYNICPVAGSRLGVDEQGRHKAKRAKAGRAVRGTHWPEESRKAWSEKQKGKKLSSIHKSKIGKSSREAWTNPATKKKASVSQRESWASKSKEERARRAKPMVEAARKPEVRARAAVNIRKSLANMSEEKKALWLLRVTIAAQKRRKR